MVCQDHGSQFEGLKILVQISNNNSQGKSKNKVLLKLDAVRLSSTRSSSSNEFSCYLKSCFLCKKKLSLDKDVYMYRGDQGFCSIECRNKQIVSDEMKELESSTKHMVASYRYNNCRNDNRRETQLLLAELRRNRHKSNKQQPQHQKVHWAIVS